jgi:hypothetical protein
MLGVFVSHASDLVPGQWRASPGSSMVTFGLFATPTFLLLSGSLCGFMSLMGHEGNDRYRWRLLDRGLFLLIVGHVILSLIHGLWEPMEAAFANSFYTTDAVGVGLVFAAFVPRNTAVRHLLLFGSVLLVCSWSFAFLPEPAAHSWRFLMRWCFGLANATDQEEGYMVPVVPYLGIFAIGMAFGKRYHTWRMANESADRLAQRFIRLGAACVAAALAFKIAELVAKPHLSASMRQTLYFLTEPRQKLPPGPAYVLAFGGIGLVLAGLVHRAEKFRAGRIAQSFLATMGRASLVLFILNFLVYRFPARALNLNQFGMSMLVLFPASVLCLWCIAWAWDRSGFNRFLTLGLRRFGRPAIQAYT